MEFFQVTPPRIGNTNQYAFVGPAYQAMPYGSRRGPMLVVSHQLADEVLGLIRLGPRPEGDVTLPRPVLIDDLVLGRLHEVVDAEVGVSPPIRTQIYELKDGPGKIHYTLLSRRDWGDVQRELNDRGLDFMVTGNPYRRYSQATYFQRAVFPQKILKPPMRKRGAPRNSRTLEFLARAFREPSQ